MILFRPYVLLLSLSLGQMRGGCLYYASPDIGILPASGKSDLHLSAALLRGILHLANTSRGDLREREGISCAA